MTVRTFVREVRWRIGPYLPPGKLRVPLVHVGCTTCPERSGSLDATTEEPENWAINHAWKHPSHTGFRCVQTSLWRATPLDDDVIAVEPPAVES